LCEKPLDIVEGLDGAELLRRRDVDDHRFVSTRDRLTTLFTVPLLLPSQSMNPCSAASAIARSLRE
jgi:hypothetical protein